MRYLRQYIILSIWLITHSLLSLWGAEPSLKNIALMISGVSSAFVAEAIKDTVAKHQRPKTKRLRLIGLALVLSYPLAVY